MYNRGVLKNLLDYILIQDSKSGINLLEVQGQKSLISGKHSVIFSGFLSAIQKIAQELKVGRIAQISIDDHLCLFYHEDPINMVIMIDAGDSIDLWKEKSQTICTEFLNAFGKAFLPSNTYRFQSFVPILTKIVPEIELEKNLTKKYNCGKKSY